MSISAEMNGAVQTTTGTIPGDVAIALPSAFWSFDGNGNLLASMGAVAGADFYNLWLWNNNTSSYAFTQSFSPTPLSATISLVQGDSYNLYFMANNSFSAGENISGVFRSYVGAFFVAPTAAVPEPATWAMMLIGFGALGYILRRKHTQPHGTYA